ncbi:mitochondrial ubiquitin ligase activator of NFKB 1-like [Tubulanus polymorphus]|uniref:mitochondrial ubiquitin ligase activator of NFKB 1-like n=1 Tax=Tubulanus polymorphus TaxID=672921 RepID=UPI003DA46537
MIPLELLTFGANAAILAIFYRGYKKTKKYITAVENAPDIEVGEDLKAKLLQDGVMPYVCLSGLVTPSEKALQSQFCDDFTGVIQQLTVKEFRTRRQRGFWSDSSRVLKDIVNCIPFALRSMRPADDTLVHVAEPTKSNTLMNNLTATHDHFKPAATGWIERSLERIAGEVTKGFNESEHMLLVDSKLIAIGEVTLRNGGVITMRPPELNDLPYILGRFSKEDILKKLENRSFVYRVCTGIFTVTAIAILYIYFKKLYTTWMDERTDENLLSEVQRLRREHYEDTDGQLQHCIICLTNRRDVVLLDCGHICTCAECAVMLPAPRRCPICRTDIREVIPVYTP